MTPPSWHAVSFYTTGTGYEDEAKKLEASAKALSIPLSIYRTPPTGTWRGNLNQKSATILCAFEDFAPRDIVFIDADAVFRRWPVLFDELSKSHAYDLSAHFFRYSPASGDADELLSGTLWIQNGETGQLLVKRWHAIGLRHPEIRHQMCLKHAIASLRTEGREVKVFRHPFEYTCIFDYHAARAGKDPVIEHFQASRRLRKTVGFGKPLISGRRGDSSRVALARARLGSQANNINVVRRISFADRRRAK